MIFLFKELKFCFFFSSLNANFPGCNFPTKNPHGDELPTSLNPPILPSGSFWDRGSAACPSARVVKVLKLSQEAFFCNDFWWSKKESDSIRTS